MKSEFEIEKYNGEILRRIGAYLNYGERSIDAAQVKKVSGCGVGKAKAVELLLAGYIDADEILEKEYLPYMLKLLDIDDYKADRYYQDIKFPNTACGRWQFKTHSYAPYEIFVRDDFEFSGGRVLPQLGYFDMEFIYPAVYQDGVLWMSVTPNEINTMAQPISKAHGNVLTFGLGLGYFAYMCLQKKDVGHVTIVERDKDVIELFKRHILPQIARKQDVTIVENDAYEYLRSMNDGEFDYAFVDIYHDAGDGREVYLKFKKFEDRLKRTEFDYWIEKTIKYYL